MTDLITTFDDADLREFYQAHSGLLQKALEDKPALLATLPRNAAVVEPAGLVAPVTVDPSLPEIVLLHGITDSHLANSAGGRLNRIWLDMLELLKGQFTRRLTLREDASDPVGSAMVTNGYATKKYQAALDRWTAQRFRTHVFQYDWRKTVRSAARDLEAFLAGLDSVSKGRKVVLVCHSMGGLVAATYAAQSAEWEKQVEHCVFAGSPLGGSYSPVESILGLADSIRKLARLSLFESQQDFQRMVASFPGLIDMLPNPELFPDAADLYQQSGWPGPIRPRQEWLDDSRALKEVLWTSPIHKVATHLVANGRPTIGAFPWNGGQTERTRVMSNEGDGAVMNKASLVPGVPAYRVDADHGMLVTLPTVHEAVIRIARGLKPELSEARIGSLTDANSAGLIAPAGLVGLVAPPSTNTTYALAGALAPHFASSTALDANFEADDRQNIQDFDRAALRSKPFSWQNALSLAVASKIAYRRETAAVKLLATVGWGFSGCEVFDQEDTQGFICWDDHVVVLSYRGTEQNLADWLRNLQAVGHQTTYGLVHAGFLAGFGVARDPVEKILKSIDRIDEKVMWITGHSLGGALALVAGAEFQKTYPIAGLYTYGQPKVGDGKFADFYNQHYPDRLHRVVNFQDVVPMVPPFYQHVGKLYHFDRDGAAVMGLIQPGALEVTVSDTQRELSEPEFERLKERLDALSEPAAPEGLILPDALAVLPPSEPQIETQAALFGVSVSDHNLDKGYIPRVRAQRDRS